MKLNFVERWLVNSPLRAALQAGVARRLRAMAEPGPEAAVLEIGCGRGLGGRLIARHFNPARLFLMDLDPAMARLARGDGALVLVGDAEALPIKDDSLDAVFGFGFLHHVPDWRLALSEVARVLKPGGFYFLEEYYPATYLNPLTRRVLRHPEHDRFHSHDLHAELARAGFGLLAARERAWWGIEAAARKQ